MSGPAALSGWPAGVRLREILRTALRVGCRGRTRKKGAGLAEPQTLESIHGRMPAATRRRRRSAACLCLLAAAAAVVAAAPASGAAGNAALPDRRIAVRWTITWGGLPIYKAHLRIEIADSRYTADFSARSLGVVEVAAKSRTFWNTSGRINGGAMVPEKMRQRYLMKRGGYRNVSMVWAPSGAVSTHIDPPEPEGKRKKVPDELQRGTLDPLTAILDGLVAPRGGPPCKYEAKLFEGRRRIDIRLSFHRYGKALRLKGHKLPRKATVCLLHAERVAGFRARHLKDVPKLHPLKLWIVRLEKPGLWLPVEMALKTPYGIARARLSKLEIR